jgi:hypothetical protein
MAKISDEEISQWFVGSAMPDLLGSDFSLAESHKLYRVHELLLGHKAELFSYLQQRWKDLFSTSPKNSQKS